MAEYKQSGKCRSLIIAGCMGQRYGEELLKEFPEVDAIVGTGAWSRIMEAVDATVNEHKRVPHHGRVEGNIYGHLAAYFYDTVLYGVYKNRLKAVITAVLTALYRMCAAITAAHD